MVQQLKERRKKKKIKEFTFGDIEEKKDNCIWFCELMLDLGDNGLTKVGNGHWLSKD